MDKGFKKCWALDWRRQCGQQRWQAAEEAAKTAEQMPRRQEVQAHRQQEGAKASKLPLNSSISCRKSHVCSILTK